LPGTPRSSARPRPELGSERRAAIAGLLDAEPGRGTGPDGDSLHADAQGFENVQVEVLAHLHDQADAVEERGRGEGRGEAGSAHVGGYGAVGRPVHGEADVTDEDQIGRGHHGEHDFRLPSRRPVKFRLNSRMTVFS
jgi:hypothetical protein